MELVSWKYPSIIAIIQLMLNAKGIMFLISKNVYVTEIKNEILKLNKNKNLHTIMIYLLDLL